MTLTAAAVCPHPPLLVPEVAGAAAGELDGLRAACDEAVRRLYAAGADLIAVVGAAPRTADFGPDPAGTLRPYGIDLTVGAGRPVLPLSLTLGRWLMQRAQRAGVAGSAARTAWHGIGSQATPDACRELGRQLAARAPTVALLCMGDGAAGRDTATPEAADPRIAEFDAAVTAALGQADTAALAGLDPALAAGLTAAGRPAWQTLAGAAGDARFTGELLADQSPYGVRYYVASWQARAPGGV